MHLKDAFSDLHCKLRKKMRNAAVLLLPLRYSCPDVDAKAESWTHKKLQGLCPSGNSIASVGY